MRGFLAVTDGRRERSIRGNNQMFSFHRQGLDPCLRRGDMSNVDRW